MKARDENRKEKVDLKKREKVEVLGENLKLSLDKDAERLLKKREFLQEMPQDKTPKTNLSASRKKTGEGGKAGKGVESDREIGQKNDRRTGNAILPGEQPEKKRLIEHTHTAPLEEAKATVPPVARKPVLPSENVKRIAYSVEKTAAKLAERADDGSGAMQMSQKAGNHLAYAYEKGIKATVHIARNIGTDMERKEKQKLSPEDVRRKIRKEKQELPEKEKKSVRNDRQKITVQTKAGEAEKKKSPGIKKEAAKKKRQAACREADGSLPCTLKKQGKQNPIICRESAFQNAVEETLSRSRYRLYTQDNEKKVEELRMQAVSNPEYPMIKNPIKEQPVETPASGENPGMKKIRKKKLIEFYRRNEMESLSASIKKTGKKIGKSSKQALETGLKAGNPAGWTVLAVAGGGIILIVISFILLLFLCVAEGNDTSHTIPIVKTFSVKTESYRNDVLKEAEKYHMEKYINLFLAVMEVESHGSGNDVFQCSESLGRPRNSLSVQESIVQGVKYLTACIKEAKVQSPSDFDNIRTAVQGYNFGNGYIPWAMKKDGGWTQENALEFARIHSKGIKRKGDSYIKRAGPWNYGDQYYADHVMEYYASETEASAGEAGTVPLKDRMKWLFPEGTPKTPTEMSKYLIQISVPIFDKNGKTSTMKLTVHKKLASEIRAVFEDLKKARVRTIPSCTAAYNWRKMATNSSKLSYHSYGSVVDWNWSYNPICYPNLPGYDSQPKNDYMANKLVVDIWKGHGFYWGGDWKSYHDYMHFSYTNN